MDHGVAFLRDGARRCSCKMVFLAAYVARSAVRDHPCDVGGSRGPELAAELGALQGQAVLLLRVRVCGP